MPVCLLRNRLPRFLRLLNTSYLQSRVSRRRLCSRPVSAMDKTRGRPPRCYVRHVIFPANDTHCTANHMTARNEQPQKTWHLSEQTSSKDLPMDAPVQNAGLDARKRIQNDGDRSKWTRAPASRAECGALVHGPPRQRAAAGPRARCQTKEAATTALQISPIFIAPNAQLVRLLLGQYDICIFLSRINLIFSQAHFWLFFLPFV
jgi:hypothetical protein